MNPEADFAEIYEGLQKLPNWQERRELLPLLIDAWVKVDAFGALQHLRNTPGGSEFVYALFQSWARVDPDVARQFVRDFDTSTERAYAWEALLSTLSTTDPEKYFQFRSEEGVEGRGTSKAHDAYRTLAERDVDRALEMMEKAVGEDRGLAASGVAEVLARETPEEALAFARSLDPEMKAVALRGILSVWQPKELEDAAELLEEAAAAIEAGKWDEIFIGMKAPLDDAFNLEDRRLEMARDSYLTMPSIEFAERLSSRHEPREMSEWVQRHLAPVAQLSFFQRKIQSTMEEDASTALPWLEGIDNEFIVRQVFSSLPSEPPRWQLEQWVELVETTRDPSLASIGAEMLMSQLEGEVGENADLLERLRPFHK